MLAELRLNEPVMPEKIGKKVCMPPGNALRFTPLGKLRLREGPRRLKQPIKCRPVWFGY